MLFARRTADITQGVIWKHLLAFFFPLWFGTFFQQLYSTVDALVVGRFVGTGALAAVGATGPVTNLTVGIFTGLASGAVVGIAQHYGARHWDDVHQSVHTAMLLSLIIGLGFSVGGFLLAPGVLRAMGTPDDVFADSVLYLRIYFAGMLPNVVYNMGTGVLRAVGDFRRPLYFLVAACLCNIVLDLLLAVVIPLGIWGVGLATVFSQLLSAVLVVLSLLHAEGAPYRLSLSELRIHSRPLRRILRVGVPTALQSSMYNLSNIAIQASINSFGTVVVAAWTAYGKMDIFFWMTMSAMSQSLTTFASQNFGAGRYDRLRRGTWVAAGITALFTLAISTGMVLLADPLMNVFCPDPAVVDVGVTMVRFLAPVYITYILVELLPGAIRGAGRSLVPMLISVFGVCVLRLAWLFFAVPLHPTIQMVETSYPLTWIVTSLAMLAYYRFGHWLPDLSRALRQD